MVYELPDRNGNQKFVGIAFVIGLHILLIIGLASGLSAHIKLPLPEAVATIFQEEQKPASEPIPPPPKPAMVEPEMPTLPVPIVQIAQDAPVVMSVPAIQSTSTDAGVGSAISTDKPTVSAQVACPNSDTVRASASYPVAARREGIQGDVVARFVVGAGGQIKNIAVVQSANKILNPAVIAAVRQFQCVAQASDVLVEVPFSFRLN